jgi:hypothetical protein
MYRPIASVVAVPAETQLLGDLTQYISSTTFPLIGIACR